MPDEGIAMELSSQMQLAMSGQSTDVVTYVIAFLAADIAVNVATTREVGEMVIDHIADAAKAKLLRDWSEGKERLAMIPERISENQQ